MPKLSVLMPCKNLNENCKKAIDSILAQNVDLELIITVDGGENNLVINDPRVIIKTLEKNLGPSAAINNCYKYSSGKYITVHDDDDWSEQGRYEMLLREIGNDRAITSAINKHKNGKISIKLFEQNNMIENNKIKSFMHHCATIIRKDLWDELGSYDERFLSADSIRMIRLVMYFDIKNEKIAIVDKPLYNYNMRDGTVSKSEKWRGEIAKIRRYLVITYNKYKNNPKLFLEESKIKKSGRQHDL